MIVFFLLSFVCFFFRVVLTRESLGLCSFLWNSFLWNRRHNDLTKNSVCVCVCRLAVRARVCQQQQQRALALCVCVCVSAYGGERC